MYRKTGLQTTTASEFELPFGGKLAEDNRWVMMAQLIPWSEFEQEYAENFATEMGAPAKSFRMALGALIIKEKLSISFLRNSRTAPGKPLLTVLYRREIL